MNTLATTGIPGVANTSLPHFALALGDNFYSHGIGTDCHDPRFVNTFEKVYSGAALQVRRIA